MRTCMIFVLLISAALAVEIKDKGAKNVKTQEKRGTEEDYDSYNSPSYDNNGAVSYSHVQNSHPKEHQVKLIKEVHPYAVAVNKHLPVAVKIPVQVDERPVYQQHIDRGYIQHSNQPIQVVKQVPYYVERPLQVKIPIPAIPIKEHPTEFVLTKVPLVYQASYAEQSYQPGPGYNQVYQPGYNQGFQNGRNQVYQPIQYDHNRQYQQVIPAQIAYEGH